MSKTKREIVAQTLRTRDPEVLSYQILFFPIQEERVKLYFKTEDVDAGIGNYIRWYYVPFWKDLGDDLLEDEFGVVWKRNSSNRGYVVKHPLLEPDIRKLRIRRYNCAKGLESRLQNDRDYYTIFWCGAIFERAHMLRGMEQLFLDFYYNPKFVNELLEILADVVVRNIEAIKDLDIPSVFLSDDYGSQNGLLLGKEMWREFIMPHVKRVVDCAHKCDKAVFLHSDGNIAELIPDFIKLGIDALHPVQAEVMDFKQLKRNYGRDICFYGGIGTQTTLLNETADSVKNEIIRLKDLDNSAQGFILAPSLQLLEDIPFENILALIEAVQAFK